MQRRTKLPEGLTGIANLMEMTKEEVRAWPYYKELRSLFKDYNLQAVSKARLLSRLTDISLKCANDEIYHYSTGIENAATAIRACY